MGSLRLNTYSNCPFSTQAFQNHTTLDFQGLHPNLAFSKKLFLIKKFFFGFLCSKNQCLLSLTLSEFLVWMNHLNLYCILLSIYVCVCIGAWLNCRGQRTTCGVNSLFPSCRPSGLTRAFTHRAFGSLHTLILHRLLSWHIYLSGLLY